MTNNWIEVTLDEIKDSSHHALATGPFGSSISAKFFQSFGVPVIRGSNLSEDIGQRLITDEFVFLSPEKAQEFRRSVVRKGDLVFTCWGTIGQVGFIDEHSPFDEYIVSNKQMKFTPDVDKADGKFLYYLFSGPEVSEQIKSQAIGSSVPGFNLGQLRSIKFNLPPLPEQRAIARILGALDDKIELNRRMNHTLEQMAAALFKSWFVDFDPVTAKLEGRAPYGMNAATAALFPAAFQDSELGPIPEGWRVESLGNLLNIIKGRSYSSSELQASDTALVTLKSIARGGGYKPDGLKPFTGKYKPEQILNSGDLVVACTDITQNADVVGRPALIPTEKRFKTLVASLDLLILRSSDDVSIPFLYSLLQTEDYVGHIIGHANGTTVLHLSNQGVPTYKFAKPPSLILRAFTRFAVPLYEHIELNQQEAVNLAHIRDALLPKLLSGEIRVRAAESQVPSVKS